MIKLQDIRKKIAGKPILFDMLFLVGVFSFAAVLILGLFPRRDVGEGTGRSFFFYAMMAVPVIVAVYIIIISFRRKLSSESAQSFFSIRTKYAIAFVFVAMLPSLPIILVSNNFITHMLAELISERTSQALEESIKMSREFIGQRFEAVRTELELLDGALAGGAYAVNSPEARRAIARLYTARRLGVIFYSVVMADESGNRIAARDEALSGRYGKGVHDFLGAIRLHRGRFVYNLSIGGDSLLVGTLYTGNVLVALYDVIPERVYGRISLFEDSLGRHKQREYLKSYFQTGAGIFLLILAILIVGLSIAVSLVLSKNITRPVLELEEAARAVASGRFDIALRRDSPDELALLFKSFNTMVRQLEESRRVMFHTQKLEAWRDVARKLVHEIKNPLTPIRLSAERIQKRYRENHPEIGEIIINGTNTIIEEVNVLMAILGEFSRFARLPEMKPELEDLNAIVESCVNFFHGHERVSFRVETGQDLPSIRVDKMLLRQALTNIIQNSIDALGDSGTVHIRTYAEGGGTGLMACISVRDDGSGIREEDLERIFEPTFSTKPQGTGLGLAIVEKIVLEHRGRIRCRSKAGEGTEFVIELPVT